MVAQAIKIVGSWVKKKVKSVGIIASTFLYFYELFMEIPSMYVLYIDCPHSFR